MKTIQINTYSFNELSDKAKSCAIDNYREESHAYQSIYYEELIQSIKAMCKVLPFSIGRSSYNQLELSDFGNLSKLKGIRLYKYIINNYYNVLFKPKFIKSVGKVVYWSAFVCERYSNYTFLHSKMDINNECVLTGVCYDNDILQPIYDFLSKPDNDTTFDDIKLDIENAIEKSFNSIEEWINSDEFIIEGICNNEYVYLENGKIFQ